MLKIILAVLIVAFATYVGYFLSEKYRRRKSFMAQLFSFNERFLSELSYSRRPLKEFFKEYSYKGDFLKLLNNYSSGGIEESALSFLTADEKSYVGAYFGILGRGDAYAQSGYFAAQKQFIAEYKQGSEADAKKYCSLYIKIGFLAGLAAVVIII